jgi:hypothetical protein
MSRKRIATELSSAAGAAAAPARATRAPSHARRSKAEAASQAAPEAPVSAVEPAEEEIAALAYSYAEARGFQGGSPEQDWFRALEELRRR